MSNGRREWSWSIVAFSVLLAACSDDSPSDMNIAGGGAGNTPSNLPDPCTLATNSELQGIVNTSLSRSANRTEVGGDRRCDWYDAENLGVFALTLNVTNAHDVTKSDDAARPVSDLGSEAHFWIESSLFVRTPGRDFTAQSALPVSDGQISAPVQTALSGEREYTLATSEASYRLAKLVIDRL